MNKIDLDQFSKSLAVEMTVRTGELWRAVIDPERNPQIESSCACLYLSEDWQTHRVRFMPSAPRGTKETRNEDRITCDPGRSMAAIARDVCARILPQAVEHLTQSREYDRQRRKVEAEENTRLRLLSKYMPKRDHRGDPYDGEGMTAHITYDKQIELTIRLPIAEALKICKIIKGY